MQEICHHVNDIVPHPVYEQTLALWVTWGRPLIFKRHLHAGDICAGLIYKKFIWTCGDTQEVPQLLSRI